MAFVYCFPGHDYHQLLEQVQLASKDSATRKWTVKLEQFETLESKVKEKEKNYIHQLSKPEVNDTKYTSWLALQDSVILLTETVGDTSPNITSFYNNLKDQAHVGDYANWKMCQVSQGLVEILNYASLLADTPQKEMLVEGQVVSHSDFQIKIGQNRKKSVIVSIKYLPFSKCSKSGVEKVYAGVYQEYVEKVLKQSVGEVKWGGHESDE